jgi:hypothetical protein
MYKDGAAAILPRDTMEEDRYDILIKTRPLSGSTVDTLYEEAVEKNKLNMLGIME